MLRVGETIQVVSGRPAPPRKTSSKSNRVELKVTYSDGKRTEVKKTYYNCHCHREIEATVLFWSRDCLNFDFQGFDLVTVFHYLYVECKNQ